MNKLNCSIPFLLLLLLTLSISSASAQISIQPHGFGFPVEENEDADTELILINDYEDPVSFTISTDQREGPERNNPGEMLRQFESPIRYIGGMCFDGELLWGCPYTSRRLIAVTLDGEVVHDVEIPDINGEHPYIKGMTFDGEILWIATERRWIFTYDLEGNQLERFVIDLDHISGVASDRDQYLFLNNNDDLTIHVLLIENLEEVASFRFHHEMGGDYIRGIEWVPEHRYGQLWGISHGHMYQVFVDDEWNVEAVSDFALNNEFQACKHAHDGENMWHGSYRERTWFMFDEGVSEFYLLSFDPDEGEIPAEDAIPLEVFITTEGFEPGVYPTLITLETDRENLEITAIITIDSPTAPLTCRVLDAETNEAIQNVTVDFDEYEFRRLTNRNGICGFEEIPFGGYELTFTAENYLTHVEPCQIDDEDELLLNVELLHSECSPSRDNIEAALEQNEIVQTEVIISNDGNGPLTYTTDKRLIGDVNADPWDLRLDVPVGRITEDLQIFGAVFFEENFYVSGSNNREPVMYVLNRDQELVDQYRQLGIGRHGYKDLAYDGELIWGSGERNIYGFTPDGEEVVSFNSEIRSCTNLAWDSDREVLWTSSVTTNILGFDREGNFTAEIDRHGLYVYGLAYWSDDPDGHQLYLFHRIANVSDLIISKINIENGEITEVISLDPEEGGTALGCFFTNQFDIYSWIFMACTNKVGGDRIDMWHVNAWKDWMAIEPTAGVIEAGEQQEFEITLDATGLLPALYEGEIVFTHDGIGGETILPISLQTGEGNGGQEEMVLELNDGWNMVSVYVQPDPDNVVEIMSELVEADQLILMKNGEGRFYNPEFNFNNIPGWLVNEGYMVKVDGDAELTISGNPVNPDDPLLLIEGWQIVSYYPRRGIDAVAALSNIIDVLLMAKDARGRFYNPEFNFSNMGDMIPGQGYLLKMDEDAELVYAVEEELAQSTPFRQPDFLPTIPATDNNLSLLVITDNSEGNVGVYSNGNLVGSGVIQNGRCGIAVWGDDSTTPTIDGALPGERLEFTLADENGNRTPHTELIKGSGQYSVDDFQVIRLSEVTVYPKEFGITSVFPNPFNNYSVVKFNLPEAGVVQLILYNVLGESVRNFQIGFTEAGNHSFELNAENLVSGLYYVKLSTGADSFIRKIVMMR